MVHCRPMSSGVSDYTSIADALAFDSRLLSIHLSKDEMQCSFFFYCFKKLGLSGEAGLGEAGSSGDRNNICIFWNNRFGLRNLHLR